MFYCKWIDAIIEGVTKKRHISHLHESALNEIGKMPKIQYYWLSCYCCNANVSLLGLMVILLVKFSAFIDTNFQYFISINPSTMHELSMKIQ